MKCLVISPTPARPAYQGNRVRILQFCHAMSENGISIDFFYYALDGFDGSVAETIGAGFDNIFVSHDKGYCRQTLPDVFGIDDFVGPNGLAAARYIASITRYDLVVVNYAWCSLLAEPFKERGSFVVVDTHDVFGGRREIMIQSGFSPHWYFTSAREEGRGLDRCDIVVAIQNGEAEILRQRTSKSVLTIEYAAKPLRPKRISSSVLRVGYIGSANPWNVNSIKRLDYCLARLMSGSRRSDLQFVLYGEASRVVHDLECFESFPAATDLEEIYSRIDLAVNPMVGGTGLKIKTLEALAHGVPILSTVDGSTGIHHLHACLRFSNPLELAHYIISFVSPAVVRDLILELMPAYEELCREVDAKFQNLFAQVRLNAESDP